MKLRKRLTALALAAALLAGTIPQAGVVLGAEGDGDIGLSDATEIHEISDLTSLMSAMAISKSNGQTHTYRLTADIDLNEAAWVTLNAKGIDQVTFGDADHPFQGTFDGQGHTIKGLLYDNADSLRTCTGLIYATETNGGQKAVIKDLTITGAKLQAAGCGGIVVGNAADALITNVTVEDSFIHVHPGNQVLTLVTDGGMAGGAIAGEASGSVFYNCTVRNTRVICNRTSGVAALGGKGLYLGGMVGIASNSTIEYCRVMDGQVSNRYDNAVGAVGGYTVYAGGLTGWAGGGSKLTDCFSTATLYTYCATYVSVGSGNAGYCGGITASTNEGLSMKRCHYAGTMSSKQYNAVLVIPIIQEDHNLNGLVGINRGEEKTEVLQSWYTANDGWGGVGSTAGLAGAYGPRSAEKYADRLVWSDDGYDFTGAVERAGESAYSVPHANKWVMYTEYARDAETGALVLTDGQPTPTGRRYPVHGNSLAATFSFPNAGSVTIAPAAERSLSVAGETTSDAHSPAVLPLLPGESAVRLSAQLKDGYRLLHWHRVEGFTTAQLPHDKRYFERFFNETAGLGAGEEPYTALNCADNDLYIAHVQARVIYHDLAGDVIGSAGAKNETAVFWHNYADALPEVVPLNEDGAPEGFFVGWTAEDPAAHGRANWDNVADLAQVGELYQTGDPIEKSLSLYPVYANLLSGTVFVRVEGHTDGASCDENSLTCARDGVAAATVTKDAKGQPQLTLTGAGENGALPEGYRFLGWYEYDTKADFDGGVTANAHRVGQGFTYSLAGVGLDEKHYYEARFEYRVKLYAPHSSGSGLATKVKLEEYQSVYVPGGERLFSNVADDAVRGSGQLWESPYFQPFDFNWDASLAADQWSFACWADKAQIAGDEFSRSDYEDLQTTPGAYAWESETVTAPLELAALLNAGDYAAIGQTDFPNAGSVTLRDGAGSDYSRDPCLTVFSGYHLIFFDVVKYQKSGDVRNGHNSTSKGTAPTGAGTAEDPIIWDNDVGANTIGTDTDVYTAHMTADVTFHTGEGDTTITRRYRSPVFGSELNNDYATYDDEKAATLTFDGVSKSPAAETGVAPADPLLTGYYFAGWFQPSALTAADRAYLLDVTPAAGGPAYQTSRVDKAAAYVLSGDAVVEETMELYPLYVPYYVSARSNILDNSTGADLIPPEVRLDEQAMTVDILGALEQEADGATRAFDVLTLSIEGGEESEAPTTRDPAGEQDWATSDPYALTPGVHYQFIAYYKPWDATVRFYPTADGAAVSCRLAVDGEVGEHVPATASIDHHTTGGGASDLAGALFVGWTQSAPEDARLYHKDPDENVFYHTPGELRHTLVTGDLTFYTVYRSWTVSAATDGGEAIPGQRGDDPATVTFTAPAPAEDKVFDGWYDGAGEKVSDEAAYTPGDPFSGEGYTARYKDKPVTYTVNFHGLNGEVIDTAAVVSDQSYTFPISETEEKTFAARELTFRRDFTTAEGVKHRVDNFPQAQLDIQVALAANETFEEWVWLKADGTTENYTAFVANSTPILDIMDGAGTTTMELYPVYYAMTATKNGVDVTHTDDRASTAGKIAPAAQVAKGDSAVTFSGVTALLHANDDYSAATVVVNVQKHTWAKDGEAAVKSASPVEGAPVTLLWYEDTDAQVMDSVNTDAGGDAAFTFPLALGAVTLQLQAPAGRAGTTVLVTLSGAYTASDGAEKQYVQTIPMTCSKAGTAQAEVKPPLGGTYTVTAAATGLGFAIDPGAVTPAAGETQTVTLTATDSGGGSGSWLYATDRATNKFGQPAKEGEGA